MCQSSKIYVSCACSVFFPLHVSYDAGMFIQRFTVIAALLASCAASTKSNSALDPVRNDWVAAAQKFVDFDDSEEERSKLRVSNGWSNHGMFLSVWRDSRVRKEGGIAYLSVVDTDTENQGAEIRSNRGYLYGYFGGRMKTFSRSGTVQSIFTYNGGQYIWDEIDIEFLGKDTTKVQFNYYHEGVGGHEYMYDLGFDSSAGFHDYGFLWEENRITWFVDFVPVYTVEASLGQWGYFFINVWAGKSSVRDWLGDYAPSSTPFEAQYDYLVQRPLDE